MMTKKRIISALLAISLAAPAITAAVNPIASAADEPEITVVGKRVTGDDNYFEISLEVNGDYEDYSAVGVVLEYDPNYIIPAESWEDEAGKADMSAADSWSTRLALPTYGDPSWTTRTALTYIAQETTTDPVTGDPVTTQGKGYLYLGAEYPGKTPATTDPDAAADPGTDPAADPTDSDGDEEPHSKPIVAARFVYKGDGADAKALTAARKAVKEDLVSKWTAGDWDKDWSQNTILTVAPDAIAEKSPAQYPFAIYGADFSERVYMKSFPTATTAPAADPTATRAPYTAPATGSAITTENKLAASKLEIVTCEGKSAKSGGLELDDVFAILFFDWDDSLIGALTAAVGAKNMAETVNNYVNDKLVHKELRMDKQNYENLVSSGDYLKREFSYRGEYPYDEPSSTNPTVPVPGASKTVSDGELYPLTNKLDYVFAGKDINPELPFANGWVQVTTKDIDYSAKPGHWPEVLPKKMESTLTALRDGQTFAQIKLNDDGDVVDESGNVISPTPTIPDMVSFDFDNITEADKSYGDGSIFVKAVYDRGEKLDEGAGVSYVVKGTADNGDAKIESLGTASAGIYGIEFRYFRINATGYGVTRARLPKVSMNIIENGSSVPMAVSIDNKDVIDVQLITSKNIAEIGYQLVDTFNANIVIGNKRSDGNELGTFKAQSKDYTGFEQELLYKELTDLGLQATTNISYTRLNNCGLKTATGGSYNNRSSLGTVRTRLIQVMNDEKARSGGYPSYYQLQWAIISGESVDKATAKHNCYENRTTKTWITYEDGYTG